MPTGENLNLQLLLLNCIVFYKTRGCLGVEKYVINF
jgi:hypothetical protein